MVKAIEVKNLNYSYAGEAKKILSDVSFNVEEGEIFSIVGPSGCGKTTLALTLNGLIPKTLQGKISGEILIDGKSLESMSVPEIAQNVQILFQSPDSQLFALNVEDEISFGLENLNIPWPEIEKRVKRTLQELGIENIKDKSIEELSSGQKQKVALASVLAMNPKILILDEPTANLDYSSVDNLIEIIKKLKRKLTLIIIEHNIDFVKRVSGRVLLMDNGKVLKVDSPENIFKSKEFLSKMDLPKKEVEIKEIIKKEKQKDIGDKIIEIKNLNFHYANKKQALKNINLNINRGDFFGIVGFNGSGKSTLALNIIGLLKGKGEIKFNGENIERQDVFQRTKHIGYVFQNPNYQLFEDNIFNEIAFGPKNLGLSKNEVRRRTEEALKIINMYELAKEDPHSLSVGQKRRVTIASVLSMLPEVIILDEPDTGLDYKNARKLMEYIKKLNKAGKTIIIISHNLELIADFCNEVAYIENGEIANINNFFKQKSV